MEYDIVFLNGRVIDPETNFDGVRSIGILNGSIASISEELLKGKIELDISNLIISPGFIDVHSHEHSDEYYALKCQDGVTSVFELEVGANDIDQWYSERENKTLVNHGVGIGHIQVRMKVFDHPPGFLPQSDSPAALCPDKIDEIKSEIEYGLRRGAMAMGFGIHYVPAATRWEIVECFRLAKKYDVCCHVHMRHFGAQEKNGSLAALEEVIAVGACTQAAINVCHLHSTCLAVTDKALELLHDAHRNGMDITTEFCEFLVSSQKIEKRICLL
jgi:cytosine/adenosine deaminase-related metal-dependent hydrolase